jgi:hypothetical protein
MTDGTTGPLSIEEATNVLHALINASPRSPSKAEIGAIIARVAPAAAVPATVPDRVQRIRDAIAKIKADEDVLFGGTCPEDNDPRRVEYQKRVESGKDELNALARQLPLRPQEFSDVLSIAEIAHYWADRELDGTMSHLVREDADPFDHFSTRLVVAVLALGGPGVAA